MTPAATTPAGRTGAAQQATATAPAPGHRRGLRQPPAPRSPRRVSGPLRGRVPAPPRPQSAPRRSPDRPLPARAVAYVRALPDHSLLDRIVRGRSWIPLLGVMLAGIVAMQVEVLKLGASMGRSIELGTALQSRNELLRNSVATLADDQRIERLAAGMGMVMPAPDGVGFLSGGSPNIRQAVANIHAPNATSFLSLLSANGAVTVTPSSSPTAASTSSVSSVATPASAAPAGAAGSTATGAPATTSAGTTAVTPSTGSGTSGMAAPAQTSTGPPTSSSAAVAPTQLAPAQLAPTQSPSSSTSGAATGGAGVPTGG